MNEENNSGCKGIIQISIIVTLYFVYLIIAAETPSDDKIEVLVLSPLVGIAASLFLSFFARLLGTNWLTIFQLGNIVFWVTLILLLAAFTDAI